jgi:hypothetical protein
MAVLLSFFLMLLSADHRGGGGSRGGGFVMAAQDIALPRTKLESWQSSWESSRIKSRQQIIEILAKDVPTFKSF